MNMLKNRKFAILITVAVVVLATLFGVHRSAGKAAGQIEALFYNGVYLDEEEYREPSIDSQLKKRDTAALGLISIAANYDEVKNLNSDLKQARNDLLDAVRISDKYMADEKLQKSYEALVAALMQQELTDREKEAAEHYAATMDGARSLIQKSSYNSAVGEFMNETMGSFPVNLLKSLAFVRYPEYFGLEG
jgi:ABC-type Na+ efflux pump permease subunit